MKKLSILSIPLVILLVIIGMSTFAQSKTKILRSFEETSSNSMYMTCFNNGQIDSLGSLFLDHACSMPDGVTTIIGRAKIVEHIQQMYLNGNRFIDLKLDSQIIEGNLAFERGRWTMAVGPLQIPYSGTYFTQWHYVDGKWKIENEMNKLDVPVESN